MNLNEFKMTLLRSLDEEFRASIDTDVETLWAAPAREANESKLEELRRFHRDQK
jgi:hypothetical protein